MPLIMHESNSRLPKVAGVIVTYQPDAEGLSQLIEAIRPQVDDLLLINNGISQDLPSVAPDINLVVTNLGENFGLALAQNVGIRQAVASGASFVLLLDQDSLPTANMVAELLGAIRGLQENGVSVAAVGPLFVDERGEAAPFVYRDKSRLRLREPQNGSDVVEVDFLIASGSLIPVRVFDVVGLMEEELFIDYVDIEWGIRAKSKGYNSFGSFIAKMNHSLGDDWIEIKGRKLPIHSPLRHYYQCRNAIWLARRPWISPQWRKLFLSRQLKQFIIWVLFLSDRRKRIALMLRGAWHGVVGRTGKL